MRRNPETAINLSLPPAVEATVLVPLAQEGAVVLVNDAVVASTSAESGTRAAIVLRKPGHYRITSR
jgi:hypothetical protein